MFLRANAALGLHHVSSAKNYSETLVGVEWFKAEMTIVNSHDTWIPTLRQISPRADLFRALAAPK